MKNAFPDYNLASRALAAAAAKGDVVELERLVEEENADVDYADGAALQITVWKRQPAAARALLGLGARVLLPALRWALYHGEAEIGHMVLDRAPALAHQIENMALRQALQEVAGGGFVGSRNKDGVSRDQDLAELQPGRASLALRIRALKQAPAAAQPAVFTAHSPAAG